MGVTYFFLKYSDQKTGPYLIYKDKDIEIFNKLLDDDMYKIIIEYDGKKYKKNESILLNENIDKIFKNLKYLVKNIEYPVCFRIVLLLEYFYKFKDMLQNESEDSKYIKINKELYLLLMEYFKEWLVKEKNIKIEDYINNYTDDLDEEFFTFLKTN